MWWTTLLVARVQHCGEITLNYHSNAENMGRQGILIFYQWKNRMGVVT